MPRPRYPLKTGHEVKPIVSFSLFDKLQIPCVSFRYGKCHGDLVKIPIELKQIYTKLQIFNAYS